MYKSARKTLKGTFGVQCAHLGYGVWHSGRTGVEGWGVQCMRECQLWFSSFELSAQSYGIAQGVFNTGIRLAR